MNRYNLTAGPQVLVAAIQDFRKCLFTTNGKPAFKCSALKLLLVKHIAQIKEGFEPEAHTDQAQKPAAHLSSSSQSQVMIPKKKYCFCFVLVAVFSGSKSSQELLYWLLGIVFSRCFFVLSPHQNPSMMAFWTHTRFCLIPWYFLVECSSLNAPPYHKQKRGQVS